VSFLEWSLFSIIANMLIKELTKETGRKEKENV
jgi:hypothetical protein